MRKYIKQSLHLHNLFVHISLLTLEISIKLEGSKQPRKERSRKLHRRLCLCILRPALHPGISSRPISWWLGPRWCRVKAQIDRERGVD